MKQERFRSYSCLTPSETTVLQEELEEGWNYDNRWVQQFLKELDQREIHYVDNTEILEEKTEEGEAVFNKKYDGGHGMNWGRLWSQPYF